MICSVYIYIPFKNLCNTHRKIDSENKSFERFFDAYYTSFQAAQIFTISQNDR